MRRRPVPVTATPPAWRKAVACRLPSVMVPVLSSSRTSTSPAASTARPDMAITFCLHHAGPCRRCRWRKAAPPMVVGIRQTSNATSTVMVTGVHRPCMTSTLIGRERQQRHGRRSRKMSVSATSRMVERDLVRRLLPFGRLRPCAIMRSRNASPGFTAMRTTEPVREQPGAAGDGGEITARLPDHRGATRP